MPVANVRDFVDNTVLSASHLNEGLGGPVNDLAGRRGPIELENSLYLPDGSVLRLPSNASRPATAEAGDVIFNSTADTLDYYDGSVWRSLLNSNAVNYANLRTSGGVGTSSSQVAPGQHTHSLNQGSPQYTGTVTPSTRVVTDSSGAAGWWLVAVATFGGTIPSTTNARITATFSTAGLSSTLLLDSRIGTAPNGNEVYFFQVPAGSGNRTITLTPTIATAQPRELVFANWNVFVRFVTLGSA